MVKKYGIFFHLILFLMVLIFEYIFKNRGNLEL